MVVFLLGASQASAAIVKVVVSGTLNAPVEDGFGLFTGVSSGEPFDFVFSYDTTATDIESAPGDNISVQNVPPQMYMFTGAGITATVTDRYLLRLLDVNLNTPDQASLFASASGSVTSTFSISGTSNPIPISVDNLTMNLRLAYITDAPDADIPVDFPVGNIDLGSSLFSLDLTKFGLSKDDDIESELTGVITSVRVIPEPSALGLLAMGGLILLRRTQRRHVA